MCSVTYTTGDKEEDTSKIRWELDMTFGEKSQLDYGFVRVSEKFLGIRIFQEAWQWFDDLSSWFAIPLIKKNIWNWMHDNVNRH